MEILSRKCCGIGEGPIWRPQEKKLYYVNALAEEVCTFCFETGQETVQKYDFSVGAMGFAPDGRMLTSCTDGAFFLHPDGSRTPMHDPEDRRVYFCNDAKVGPDGRFYVGTQSRKRLRINGDVDGKLLSIDSDGNVRQLLDGMLLSNGFDWSVDMQRLYHTDSDTHLICEYAFCPVTGSVRPTGRSVKVPGVDGLTVGMDGRIYAACWGKWHVAVVDCETMKVVEHIPVPVRIPVSCCFAGEGMTQLVVTTAAYNTDLQQQPTAGFTYITQTHTHGRAPWLFGKGAL